MAKLIIKKAVKTSCEMEIFIDEKIIGVISDKQPHEFDIETGEHVFLAKTKWLGSADFTFVASEESATRLTILDKQSSEEVFWLFIVFFSVFGVVGIKGPKKALDLIIFLVICVSITVLVCVFYLLTLGPNERMEVKEG
jgi:uncharacterized membrane protein